jgi:hypothetical protein
LSKDQRSVDRYAAHAHRCANKPSKNIHSETLDEARLQLPYTPFVIARIYTLFQGCRCRMFSRSRAG